MRAKLVQLMAQISASNARVAGMKSANQQRAITDSAPAYTEDWFQSEANELERIGVQAGILDAAGG
jgi:hypothetical protein